MLAIAAALACACGRGRDQAPPCGAVAAKLLVLVQHDLDEAAQTRPLDDATRRMVTAQLPAMRDALGNACADGAWSPGVRTCLVDARDRVAFEACYAQLTDAQRGALERAALGETAAP